MLNSIKIKIDGLRLLVRGLAALRHPSLIGLVARMERYYWRHNKTVPAYAYSFPRRFLATAAKYLPISILCVTAIYALTAWAAEHSPYIPPFIHKPPSVEDFYRDFLNIDVGLLAVQITLVALVYPLVIAIVGLLFEPRTTIGGRLSVFLQETAALPTGASALLLCVALTIQFMFISQLPIRSVFAVTTLNCAWFILNLAGLGFLFLANAIDYIHPKTRPQLLRRYIVNVAWRQQLRTLMAQNRLFGATHYGYLPGGRKETSGRTSVNEDDRAPEVLMNPFFGDHGHPSVTINLRRKRALIDVRLPVLAVAAASWIELASAQATPLKKKSNTSWPTRHETPQLLFRPIYGESHSGEQVIARTEHGPPLNAVQRFLVRLAYRFRSESRTARPPTTEIFVKEAVADLIALIETNRPQEFEVQLKDLADLHIFLFEIAEVPESDGTSFNYAQIESFSGVTIGLQWAREYRDLFSRAVNKLAQEPGFFRYCASLAIRIFAAAAEKAPPAALRSISDVSIHLFFRLRDWAASSYKAESGVSPNAGMRFELEPRVRDIYAGAWRDFIAGWERLPSYFYGGQSDRGQRKWDDLVRGTESLRTHLRNTTLMVGASAWSGDLLGVQWSVDLLLRWLGQCMREWGDSVSARHQASLDTTLITTELLSRPWEEVSALPLSRFEGQTLKKSIVYGAVIENLWLDVQLALICVLIRWARGAGVNGTAALAAKMLLRNELHDRASVLNQSAPFASIGDVLESNLRVVASGGRFSRSYATEIGGIVSTLTDLTKEPWVSQRIYSSWGIDDTYELTAEQALLLVATAPNSAGPTVNLPGGLGGMLRSASERDDDDARRLLDALKALETAIDALDRGRDGPLITMLRGAQDDTNFDNWRAAAQAVVVAAIDAITAQRDERIRSATIDPARLLQIAAAASSTGFAKDTAGFPITRFSDVELTDEPLKSFTLINNGQARGELTIPLMAQPVSNEESWWAETMHDYVAAIVFNDFINAAPIEEVRADTPDAWWDAVRSAAETIDHPGGSAMLIVPSVVAPIWLSDWTWNIPRPGRPPRPQNLRVWRSDADMGPAYELHLNDIPVFRGPVEQSCSYLVPESLFRRIEFTKYPSGHAVLIEVEDDPLNDPWKAVLKATFARRVTLGDGKVVRIRFGPDATEGAGASV